MARDLALLVVGFLLTTVLGGILGSWLQQRAWNRQRAAQLREEELRRADDVCQKISQLMDKRLYRMLRLLYAFQSAARQPDSTDIIKRRLEEYDAVLYEWNDHLNLNLPLIGTYFGETARVWPDQKIYESYRQAGVELEVVYRSLTSHADSEVSLSDIEDQLTLLNDQVYRLGVFMMTQLRGGYVGRTAPETLRRSESPAAVGARSTTLTGKSQSTSKPR